MLYVNSVDYYVEYNVSIYVHAIEWLLEWWVTYDSYEHAVLELLNWVMT